MNEENFYISPQDPFDKNIIQVIYWLP